MGAWKTSCSLVMDLALSGLTVKVVFGLGGPCTALSLGLRGGGLEYQFGLGPGPCDRRVVGWSCLCLGYKWGVCFRVPSWDTGPVRLSYNPYFLACLFSQNSVFLSLQISWNNISTCFFSEANRATLVRESLGGPV